MTVLSFTSFYALAATSLFTSASALSSSDISLFPGSTSLPGSFNYAAPGYDNRPHHTRLPFSVSDTGNSAYVAVPAATSGTIWVQQVNPAANFSNVGKPAKVPGLLVSGIVAHDDGFAVLVNRKDGSTSNGEPAAYLVRYTGGTETWATALNGKTITDDDPDTSSDVLTGDLVWNGSLYAAYFVVHGASGDYKGHYGDAIQYVSPKGQRQAGYQYSSTWGCSHNEGIALAPTAEAPFLSLCSNDWQTGIYLNTDTRTMSGPKISNDQTTAGYAGEPFGGEQGSYSVVSLFQNGSALVAWSTHGAKSLADGGAGATMEVINVTPRWQVHNVAVAVLEDKSTPKTTVSLTPGTTGDANVIFLTKDSDIDHINVRTATYSEKSKVALVTYESVTSAKCTDLGTTCSGTYAGTTFVLVGGSDGAVQGQSIVRQDVFVSGDIRKLKDGSLAWPYVNAKWDLSEGASTDATATELSFAVLKVAA